MLSLPNITRYSCTPYSTYYDITAGDNHFTVTDRPNGKRDVYTYLMGVSFEISQYELVNR